MPDPDVTAFFKKTEKWKNTKEPELSEIISDRDVANLYDLSVCILNIRKKAVDAKRKTVYDNPTLENFMDELTLMIDNISKKKNIKDYIAYLPSGRQMEISTRVVYID